MHTCACAAGLGEALLKPLPAEWRYNIQRAFRCDWQGLHIASQPAPSGDDTARAKRRRHSPRQAATTARPCWLLCHVDSHAYLGGG